MATVQDFGVERAKEKKAADAAQKKAHAEEPGKGPSLANRIHTWPYLVRAEFLTGLVVMIMITVWSIVVDAPLEEPDEGMEPVEDLEELEENLPGVIASSHVRELMDEDGVGMFPGRSLPQRRWNHDHWPPPADGHGHA